MQACDQALLEVGRKIRVLNAISWPAALEARFLEDWRAGRPRLPEPALEPQPHAARSPPRRDHGELDRGHPIGNWLYKSAWSFRVAARMLAQIGSRIHPLLGAALRRPDYRATRARRRATPTPPATC
jgi:hypothetical protein